MSDHEIFNSEIESENNTPASVAAVTKPAPKASASKKTTSPKTGSKKVAAKTANTSKPKAKVTKATKTAKVVAKKEKKVNVPKAPAQKMEKILFFEENEKFGKRKNSPKFFINVRHIHVNGKDTWRRIGSVNNKIDLTKTMREFADRLHATIDQAKAVNA